MLVTLAVGIGAAPAVRAADDHDDHDHAPAETTGGRVGVLLADHGEPPEYNGWTYESFREFFQHLIRMGLIPSWLTTLDSGTMLYDADCPACAEQRVSPRLIDAWLRPHDGPAVFVPPSDSLPAHYVIPDGPGLREPDLYELVGLGAWHEWQRMGGRSPNYDEKLPRKQAVIDRLSAAYGDRLAIRVGYMIDPRFGGGHQGVREALDALVNRDRIDSLVVAYHGVGFSDIMQTHHLRHMISEHLAALGADVPVRYAAPPGTTEHYVAAIVDKVQRELANVPADAAVAIHLSGHGLPTGMCGDYDCGADAYHRSSADLFARVRPAVLAAIDRPGRTEVFHLYGDGGEDDDDPDNNVDSPIEALDKRRAAGFTVVIDIPYEFDANSRDTLIVLRQGYQRTPPDWGDDWVSHFTYKGMQVTLANATGGDTHKIDALYAVTTDALGMPNATAAASASHPSDDAHHASASAAPAEPISHAGHVSDALAASEDDVHGPVGRFDRIGEAAHLDSHVDGTHRDGSAVTAAHHHDRGRGAGTEVGWLFAIVGAAALAAAGALRGRSRVARVAVGAVGVQLVGLGWDVIAHARLGEPVHLLENAGHWLLLVGLVASAVAAVVFTRQPGVVAGASE